MKYYIILFSKTNPVLIHLDYIEIIYIIFVW